MEGSEKAGARQAHPDSQAPGGYAIGNTITLPVTACHRLVSHLPRRLPSLAPYFLPRLQLSCLPQEEVGVLSTSIKRPSAAYLRFGEAEK